MAHEKPADLNPPSAPEKDEPIFTFPNMEMFVDLKSVAPSLDVPTTFKLHDLEQDAVHKKLVAELQKDAPLRLELPCPGRHACF